MWNRRARQGEQGGKCAELEPRRTKLGLRCHRKQCARDETEQTLGQHTHGTLPGRTQVAPAGQKHRMFAF